MRIKDGDIVKHFKREINPEGYVYKVLCTNALDVTCNKRVVVYESLYESDSVHYGQIFTREYDEFMSKVDKTKYPDIKQEYRFEVL